LKCAKGNVSCSSDGKKKSLIICAASTTVISWCFYARTHMRV